MKKQIKRFSPHQTAKVFSVLIAIGVLPMAALMACITFAAPQAIDANGNPASTPPFFLFLLFPIIYLIIGYISVVIGCVLYNFMFRYIGGFELETEENDNAYQET